jgi:hypothetical protein
MWPYVLETPILRYTVLKVIKAFYTVAQLSIHNCIIISTLPRPSFSVSCHTPFTFFQLRIFRTHMAAHAPYPIRARVPSAATTPQHPSSPPTPDYACLYSMSSLTGGLSRLDLFPAEERHEERHMVLNGGCLFIGQFPVMNKPYFVPVR